MEAYYQMLKETIWDEIYIGAAIFGKYNLPRQGLLG